MAIIETIMKALDAMAVPPARQRHRSLLTFIALKLAGVLAWSWWWVLSPPWIGGFALALLAGVLTILWCVGRWADTLASLFRWRGRRQTRLFLRWDNPGRLAVAL
jgi:hypothetical protein